jgi:hypothetical protein
MSRVVHGQHRALQLGSHSHQRLAQIGGERRYPALELLELDPEGGVIRFAGQRALLSDAVAMGLLRKYLVENFGLTRRAPC